MAMIWLVILAALFKVSSLSAESCDWRLYQHYPHKGCEPVLDESGCPTKFHCTPLSDDLRQRCYHDGAWYSDRQPIPEKCESCWCTNDQLRGASIECAAVDCPDWDAQDKRCYMGYEPGACCPAEMCPSPNGTDSSCTHNGKVYKIGQIIQTDEPCQSCVCSKGWKGLEDCTKVNCLTGIYASEIRQGCVPVFNKKTCCPIDMLCGAVKGSLPVSSPVEGTEDLCHYRGNYYEKGSVVEPTANSRTKIQCECSVPPDFTCVIKKN